MRTPLTISCQHWRAAGEHTGHCALHPATEGGPRPPRAWCANHCPSHTPSRMPDTHAGEALPRQIQGGNWTTRGPEMWAELHRWAITADLSAARAWLDRFAARVPCGDCRRHWLADIQTSPPPLTSGDELFDWTVARHNCVNIRLGKPPLSMEAARDRWRHPTHSPHDLSRFFDVIWCINLDADTHRWAEFQRSLLACDWPFGAVTRLSAIQGDTVGVPDHFHQGGGAWGCLQSHRHALEQSLMSAHGRILVMEDDADLRPGFGAAVKKFLADIGEEPWDCLMLGGQHMKAPTPHKPGVVRAAAPGGIQRTHCMAFNRPFMRELYRHWSGPIDQHCDWALGPFATRFKTFAPERFIVGQRGGPSRIAGGQKPPEWWNPPRSDAPVVWLRAPRDVLEECRDRFHAGNQRNVDGVCVGLAAALDPARNRAPRQRIAAVRGWINMIQWEVESRADGAVCTIWHPAADAEIVRAAGGKKLIEIEAQTAGNAREALSAAMASSIHPSAGSMTEDIEPLHAAMRLSAP